MMSIITNPVWSLIGRTQFGLAIAALTLVGMVFYFDKRYKQSLPFSTIIIGITLSVILAYSGSQAIQGANIARHMSLAAVLLGLIFELSYRRRIHSERKAKYVGLISYSFIVALFVSAFAGTMFLDKTLSLLVLWGLSALLSILIIFQFVNRKISITVWILICLNGTVGMTLWNLWVTLPRVNI